MENKIEIPKFYEEEYVQFAIYACSRSIASYIDGLKISQRKVVHTIIEKNIKHLQVDRLSAKAAEFTKYHHGMNSLEGVTVGLARDFSGSNNLPLLTAEGNFGFRTKKENSSPRYIFTSNQEYLTDIFISKDYELLPEQHEEKELIEPRYFLPTLPLLLINGSEGIGIGYAQKIFPRDPKKIMNYIENRLNGKVPRYDFMPYFNDFRGKVIRNGTNSYEVHGKIRRVNTTTIKIVDIPFKYDIVKYTKLLDKLEDEKIIKSYIDYSEGNIFNIKVKVSRELTNNNTDEQLLIVFGLVDKMYKENLTCYDEKLSIIEFDTPQHIMERYIKVKLLYMKKRKAVIIKNSMETLKIIRSKIIFIKLVVNDKLILKNEKIKVINNKLDNIKQIIKKDESYNYLLNMSLSSLTEEKQTQLIKEMMKLKKELEDVQSTSIQQMWLNDIEKLKKYIK